MGGRRRQERRQEMKEDRPQRSSATRYQMRQKLVAIRDDFYYENEQGQKAFKVDGNELCQIQEDKVRVKDGMEVEGPGGEQLAMVKNALIMPVRGR